jgi:hypothetical protein
MLPFFPFCFLSQSPLDASFAPIFSNPYHNQKPLPLLFHSPLLLTREPKAKAKTKARKAAFGHLVTKMPCFLGPFQ